MNIYKKSIQLHKKYRGKIATSLRDLPDTQLKLSAYYTPGVAEISRIAAKNPEKLRDYSWTNNLVAIISDGSAVLGLGDIGPYGAMPVMEGKAMLFKHFAGIDAVPIVLDVHTPEEIIAVVKAIAPSFGGINLEDINAPKCFAIEEELKSSLPIPVFHDDQHGTAVVVLAGLINAMKVVGKNLEDTKIIMLGAGAAGTAIIKLLHLYAKPSITAVDSRGIISKDRLDLNEEKRLLLKFTNNDNLSGSLSDAMKGTDIFIGVSKGDILTPAHIKTMANKPVVFALANPNPELNPKLVKNLNIAVYATGRSDLPNQVNNALGFPGIFRGALDNRVRRITDEHKIAAAKAIANLIKKPTADYIIPSVMNKKLVPAIAKVIK